MKVAIPLLLVFLLPCRVFGQTTANLTETPKPADSFVDSVGVNVHMTYFDTAYGNVPAVTRMLSQLGVRHVRDGSPYFASDPNYNEREYKAFGAVSGLGVGFDLVISFFRGGDPNPITPAFMDILHGLAQINGVTVDSYEGPNEVDIQGDNNWLLNTKSFMASFYSSAKSTANTAAIPIVGNTLAGQALDWTLLGDMTAYQDRGNMHPYANTQYPSFLFTQDLAAARQVSGSQTIYVTEAGWSNAMQATDNTPNVTEDVSARYIGRLFFETLLHGWPRTYAYELVDEKPDPGLTKTQQHFGLFRNDYSAKPAALMVSNLTKLMSDQGPAAHLRMLSYVLTLPSPSIHHILFQKRDGSYWLALWQEVSNWKGWNAQGTAVTNPDAAVTISLTMPASSIEAYNPRTSTEPLTSLSNQKVFTVMVPDNPVLVKIALLAPPTGVAVDATQ